MKRESGGTRASGTLAPWVMDLRAQFARIEPGVRVLEEATREAGRALGAMSGAHRYALGERGWACDFQYHEGLSRQAQALRSYFTGAPVSHSAFNLLAPEPAERNRVRGSAYMAEIMNCDEPPDIVTRFYQPTGLAALAQMRVVLCDGPLYLGWFGFFRDAAFTRAEELQFEGLVPALVERLRAERSLGFPSTIDALVAALEFIGAPAFLVHRRHGIEMTNSVGLAMLAREGRALTASLYTALEAPEPSGIEVRWVHARGVPDCALLVLRDGAHGMFEARLQSALRRWVLTAREQAVLALAVQGESNKDIAERLGASPRTVEVHVSALLRKARCESRAELAARFWTL